MMKNTLLLTAGLAIAAIGQSQTLMQDSVIMGASYANQMYYDVKTGEKNGSPVNNWDIAHTTVGRDNCIRANHMSGLRVYRYPNGKATDWSSFDTTGFSGGNWRPLWNDQHVHEKGAFTLHQDLANWRFGWGYYDQVTKLVTGDSLYLLAWTGPGGMGWSKFLKFLPVVQLANGDLVIKYADLNGANEVTDTLYQSQAAGMMYKYYKFSNDTKPVREPGSDKWDISFTRYYEPTLNPGTGDYEMYPVMGIESKRGTLVARIGNTPWNNVLTDSGWLVGKNGKAFKNDLTGIGSNWKVLNGSAFEVKDTVSYIIRRTRTADTSYWLMHMTRFVGSSAGKTVFVKMQLRNTLSAEHPVFGKVQVFPNPVKEKLIISFEDKAFGQATVRLLDLQGREVAAQPFSQNSLFGAAEVPVNGLKSGVYLLNITANGQSFSSRIVVE